jgi:hypothetical protein
MRHTSLRIADMQGRREAHEQAAVGICRRGIEPRPRRAGIGSSRLLVGTRCSRTSAML